jgi:aminoglycoside phosphotransferase (APT) family kinase protein
MSSAPERHVSVLRVVDRHVGALAPQVPVPQIGEALGYLGGLVGYAASAADHGRRLAAHEPALNALCAQAEALCAEHSIVVPDHEHRPSRAVVAATLASAEGIPGARELHAELVELVETIELGPAGDGAPEHAPQTDPGTDGITDALTTYLRRRTGDEQVVAEDVRQITGGFSKITTLVSYTTGGERQAIALRQVPPGLVDETLVPEYEVLRAVWRPDIPVPEPLWVEPEVNDLGGPFFASRQASGRNLGTVMGATEEVPESVCLELAEFLGRLHSTDVGLVRSTPVSNMRTREEIEHAISDEEKDSLGTALEPQPLLAGMFAWLRAHAPERTERPVIVHGDLGFHNLLVEDGHVTAVLDWERAHIGDAAEELAYLRPSIEPVFSWDRFLERYVEAGGRVPQDPDVDRFYDVWKDVWRCAQCVRIGTDFDRGDTRLPAAIAGCLLAPRFLGAAMRAALGPKVPVAG